MIVKEQHKGMISIALCAILWSSGGLFIKLVNWHPFATAGMRSLIAGLFIVFLLKPIPRRFSRVQVVTAVFHSLTMILFVTATRTTTSANAIMLQYTAPVYVALAGWFLLKEKPAYHHWIAMGASCIGMVLFFKDELSVGQQWGNIIALGSGISFAFFSIFMRKQKHGNPLESLLLSNFITFLVGIPFYFSSPLPQVEGWLSIAALGLFQTGLALVLFSSGIKKVTALSAMLIAVLEPLLNPVWVFLFTGELPGMWSLIGGTLIITTVTASSILSALGESAIVEEKVGSQ